jgi:hypothetical protein
MHASGFGGFATDLMESMSLETKGGRSNGEPEIWELRSIMIFSIPRAAAAANLTLCSLSRLRFFLFLLLIASWSLMMSFNADRDVYLISGNTILKVTV